jgi:hypothetical protein
VDHAPLLLSGRRFASRRRILQRTEQQSRAIHCESQNVAARRRLVFRVVVLLAEAYS